MSYPIINRNNYPCSNPTEIATFFALANGTRDDANTGWNFSIVSLHFQALIYVCNATFNSSTLLWFVTDTNLALNNNLLNAVDGNQIIWNAINDEYQFYFTTA